VRDALIRFGIESALSGWPGTIRSGVFRLARRVSIVRPGTLRIPWLRGVSLHRHLLLGTSTLRHAAA